MGICGTFEYPTIYNGSGPLKFTSKISHFGPFCLINPFAKCPRITSLASFETLSISQGILDLFSCLLILICMERSKMVLESINTT